MNIGRWFRLGMASLTLPALMAAAEASPNVTPTGPVVQTTGGALQGVAETGTSSFLGVPFAAPPVGALRWRPPAPAPAWQGVRSAADMSKPCKQAPQVASPNAVYSEDCLYLNVYAPVGSDPRSALRPVMLWLHGGAFTSGSASGYDPRELARRTGTVVVTINYRLGLFGFAALPAILAEGHGGNFGLLDQVASMRWVQDNIKAFGGDPGRVTLFGQSAGGTSICTHLMSPLAKGLFHGAIIQSGSCWVALNPIATARQSIEQVADKLGCVAGPDQLACLKSKSADNIMSATPGMDPAQVSSVAAVAPFVDGVAVGSNLNQQLSKGNFNQMPVLIGATRDEGRVAPGLAFHMLRNEPLGEAEYQSIVQGMTGGPEMARLLMGSYSTKNYGSPSLAFGALLTDVVFACPSLSFARGLSRHVPTYYYEFQDRTVELPTPDPFMHWGAFHGAELGSLFHSPAQYAEAAPERRAMADRMIAYWGNFAWTGNPGRAEPTSAPWPQYKAPLFAVQTLHPVPTKPNWTGGVYREHRCLLWDLTTALGGLAQAAKPPAGVAE